MAIDETFVDYSGPVIAADWLNNVNQFVNRPWRKYNIIDEGAVAGGPDCTAVMNSLKAKLAAEGGGIIEIPTYGDFYMNFVLDEPNIWLVGVGGASEYNQYCLRPFSLASPTITIGNDTALQFYNGLFNLAVAGCDMSASATLAAHNAPNAILFKGGVTKFRWENVSAYNGLVTVALVPSATQPVTSNYFHGGNIRNDISDSTSARSLYTRRLPGDGYNTDNKFIRVKGNGPVLGYAIEVDGSVTGCALEINYSYWDVRADHGVLLRGASQLVGIGTTIDPSYSGTPDVIVLESDQASNNLNRLLKGQFFVGASRFKTATTGALGFAIPEEADWFLYKLIAQNGYYLGPQVWSSAADPYDAAGTAPYQDLATTTGPLLTYKGTGDGIETVNGARVTRGQTSEEITLSTVAAFTDSSANLLPSDSYITAVVMRVTVGITGPTASISMGTSVNSTRFSSLAADLPVNSTRVGLNHRDQTGTAGPIQAAAAKVRISTSGGTPTAGKVRVTVFYEQYRAPTS